MRATGHGDKIGRGALGPYPDPAAAHSMSAISGAPPPSTPRSCASRPNAALSAGAKPRRGRRHGDNHGAGPLINQEFAPLLIGRDPREITAIWEQLYNGTRAHYALRAGHVFPAIGRRGVSVSAIIGIDIALWDLLGKSLGVPVWRLLGGRRAERMPAYASGGWADAARHRRRSSRTYVASGGFKAVKMRVGVIDGDPRLSAERVSAARAALGPGIELMCDAHGTFHRRRGAALLPPGRGLRPRLVRGAGHRRRQARPGRGAAATAYPDRRRRERVHPLRFPRPDRRCGAVDILQPDLAICGGITEARRIDALAAAHNLSSRRICGPARRPSSPACIAAAAARRVHPRIFARRQSHAARPDRGAFTVEDGMIAIPDRPGLGITVREDFLARHTVPV